MNVFEAIEALYYYLKMGVLSFQNATERGRTRSHPKDYILVFAISPRPFLLLVRVSRVPDGHTLNRWA